MSTSEVIVLLQQIIVSLAVDQYSHSTPIMLKDESSGEAALLESGNRRAALGRGDKEQGSSFRAR